MKGENFRVGDLCEIAGGTDAFFGAFVIALELPTSRQSMGKILTKDGPVSCFWRQLKRVSDDLH